MPHRVARVFVVAAQQVDEECVLPGTAAQGTGLNLAQADIAQGEDAERLEQAAGNVLGAESERSLIGIGRGLRLSALD